MKCFLLDSVDEYDEPRLRRPRSYSAKSVHLCHRASPSHFATLNLRIWIFANIRASR